MADRTFSWGEGSPTMRRATEMDGRRRHDQQRLLVELELDDSLYHGTVRAGMEQNALYPDGRRSGHIGDTNYRQPHPSYGHHFIAELKPRLQSRTPRDTAAKPLTERQMQQLHAKRLSSPFKLKQQVLGTRNDRTPRRYQQKSPHMSTQRVVRSSVQPSSAHLVIESVRQNIHLRDQVVAHLQQELMGVLPLHRASHVEKNVPQRVVKLLNRMRSLSLAVVEAVVYLSNEIGESNVVGASVEHEILEQEFYGYLLRMASADTDFLVCSPQLQRFLEDFEVNLTRNPFVDGLSLDSSEILLCSCHQSAASRALFCSASSSSSSLLRLLTQKLETFALQTQRYLPGWQLLPAQRVAAALLHLMDLETRLTAVQMLPRYLQSNTSYMTHVHEQSQQRGSDGTLYRYDTIEDERIQRLDRQDLHNSQTRDNDVLRSEISAMEAWTGSPTVKSPVPSNVTVVKTDQLLSQTSGDSSRRLSSREDVARSPYEARQPSSRSSTPTRFDDPMVPSTTDRRFSRQEDDIKSSRSSSRVGPLTVTDQLVSSTASNESAWRLSSREEEKTRKLSTAWMPFPSPTDPDNLRTDSPLNSSASVSSRKLSTGGDSAGDLKLELARIVLPDTTAIAKSSGRSSSDRSVSQKKSRTATFTDTAIQLSRPGTPTTTATQTTSRSVANISALFLLEEAVRSRANGDENGEREKMSSVPIISYENPQLPECNTVEIIAESSASMETSGYLGQLEHIKSAKSEELMSVNDAESVTFPTSNDDGYECDFEYSSSETLSRIAMALQMLPSFSLTTTSFTVADEVFKPEETIPFIEHESEGTSRMEAPVLSHKSTLFEVENSLEKARNDPEIFAQHAETPPPDDDEYAYSSTDAISNIAKALSLLPSVSRDDIFSVSEEKSGLELDIPLERDSTRVTTSRSFGSQLDGNWQISSVDEADKISIKNALEYYSLPSARCNNSAETIHQPIPTERNNEVAYSRPVSSRSNILETPSSQRDDVSQTSEFNRIFALCQDIQVAAFDMNHWVSQREVEDQLQSFAQFSSSTTESVKVDKTRHYLERELKMLRRNVASWRKWVVHHQRAKLVVRRVVARRKVRQFVLFHHRQRVQARMDEETRRILLAASRIQRNWRICCHERDIAKRRASFRTLHLFFHRVLFFVGISRRQQRREDAKEKLVQWWRHRRACIKKKKQQKEKNMREREKRAKALREIQTFLREILLRRKLKAAQEMARKVLFHEQLKWTKAKRDVERSMKLHSKHKRELRVEMNTRLAELDHRWKTSEEDRAQLRTQHERMELQQQQVADVWRRNVAALKLEMFFRVCLLHKQLEKVEKDKKEYEMKLQTAALTKEELEFQTHKRISQSRIQVRVLERKMGRMAQGALHTEAQHVEIVQAHQELARVSQVRAARQTMKTFINHRLLSRRAETERRRFELEQTQLQAEKTETELMSSADQLEQRRATFSLVSGLEQRLFEVETRSEALLAATNQLEAEKQEQIRLAAETLERSQIQARMHQIASWVSRQMQLLKLQKEKAAIRAAAAHDLEEEKHKQRQVFEAKMREVTSIKAPSSASQRSRQPRSHKTIETIRIQQQKIELDKAVAARTRAQLVQIILDVKLLTEHESHTGVTQGLAGVAQFYKVQLNRFARLKALRRLNYARKIQRLWRRWAKQRSKRAQEVGQIQAKQRQEVARRLQFWWRKWQRRRQEQLVFTAQLKAIRVRIIVRNIQRGWRRWIELKKERRREQTRAFEALVTAIRTRSSVRRIQTNWRRWIQHEYERRRQVQRVFDDHLLAIRVRVYARKIQNVWRRWAQDERVRRHVQELAHGAQLRALCIRAKVRMIQRVWRYWANDRRQRAFDTYLELIRVRANVRKIQGSWRRWVQANQAVRRRYRLVFFSTLRIQKWWMKWRRQHRVKATRTRIMRNACAQVIQRKWRRWHRWRLTKREIRRLQKQREACATRLQRYWQQWLCKRQYATEKSRKRQAMERQTQERTAAVSIIQKQWRSIQFSRRQKEQNQRELERFHESQDASSLTIQRNWKIRHHRLLMERQRIQHEQHMAALKIQTLWLKWHHKQAEELERESIRQEQYESSLKIERSCGISHQRRKVAQERLRHLQNLNALKIQKHWKRWWHFRLERRFNRLSLAITTEVEAESIQYAQERQQKLEKITQRSYGQCIVRAVQRYHQKRREESAATKIEAIWKGTLSRCLYFQALEAKHAEEVRQYRLLMSVTKVQHYWRRWHTGVRQIKRAAVKSDELRLIQEAKTLKRKLQVAKRVVAAKRIQRALACRRRLIARREISVRKDLEELDKTIDQEPGTDLQEVIEVPTYQSPNEELEENDVIRIAVDWIVDDWGHRELPHILSRTVNQVLFCHEAVSVLQKCVRGYQRRQQMQFYFQYSFVVSSSSDFLGNKVKSERFHLYFKKASAWLDWNLAESTSLGSLRADTDLNISLLRLRFDSQLTRKLLQLLEPNDEYSKSDIQQVLHEIAADALPILQSPICWEDNENPRPELRYHDVEEMELCRAVKILRQMGQQRAQIRRQQFLEVDSSVEELLVVTTSTPVSPIGKSSAPSSPSQRVKKEMTIFTAVENASVEDATFLMQRGADLAALEPKTQRNALHLLSFSKENYRSRAEMLDFLLCCGANLNVNAQDWNGETPLMLFASLGQLEFMHKLLQHGADIQLTNARGHNVLHRACDEDQVEICGFLQQLMMKDSIAENVFPVETIASLVPTALSLHTPDNLGRYPLHCLAEKGFVECSKQLVVPTEANYDWNRWLQAQGDSEARTALHVAVLTHDAAMITFLLTPGGGSNVNAFDKLHRSPLHYAVESPAALAIIPRLVQHGANVNVSDERGDTPLHWTAFGGRTTMTQHLLAFGADPTLVNSDWETPAQIAAAYGQLDCLRLLLQAQRRIGAVSDQLKRPASDKTALQRLEEAVNHLHETQAAACSSQDQNTESDTRSSNDASVIRAEQSHGNYWEELHQVVQLVEESGQFSSEDEEDLLLGSDNETSFNIHDSQ